MRQDVNVQLHNRFDIEVRDVLTGEVKQRAEAYNIVLNQMYARLCAGANFFSYIRFGAGTGALDPARTQLFSSVGYKAVENPLYTYGVATSYGRKTCTLAPEEYVGATLTEVGVAYSTDATSLVTHALIRDVEGNPISISKTATELITIYATIYATLAYDEAINLAAPLAGNALLQYLVGASGSFGNRTFSWGTNDLHVSDVANTNATGTLSVPIFTSASLTGTADTANRKRTYSVRTAIGEANYFLREFAVSNVLRLPFANTSVFDGQAYTGVAIGNGDGSKVRFPLPSMDVRLATLDVRLNGVETAGYTVERVLRPSMTGRFVLSAACAISTRGGWLVQVVSYVVSVYQRSGFEWVPYATFAYASSSIDKLTISEDGSVILVNSTTYKWNATDEVYVAFENSRPESLGHDYILSADGTILVAAGASGPTWQTLLYLWDAVNGVWVLTAQGGYIETSGFGRAYTGVWRSATLCFIQSSDYNYATYMNFVDGAFVVRRLPPSEIGGFAYGLSDDGITAAYGKGTELSHAIGIAQWVDSAWSDVDMIPLPDLTTVIGVCIDNAATRAIVMYNQRVDTHEKIDGAWRLTGSIIVQANNNMYAGYRVSEDMRTLVCYSLDGCAVVVDIAEEQYDVIMDSAPAAGVAVTADYTVDGIHKTSQYVIDTVFTLTFAEGA